jgi:putative peptidoglycan lipid II flippase
MADAYRRGMRLILLINVPAAAGLAVLAVPVIRLLFQRGQFAASDTLEMAPVLAAYAAGLPFFSFVTLVLRAFYAKRHMATPVWAALLSFAVNIGLCLALMRPLSTLGLAIAGNVAIVAQAVFLQFMLTRKMPGMAFRHIGRDLAKIVCAAALMGAAVLGGWRAWTYFVTSPRWIALACGLAIMIAGGVALYAALVWMLRVEGREEVRAAILRKFGRTAPPAP